MRRIKAIHLIPVFLVLLIGAAVGAFYALFKPQMLKVTTARTEWSDAKSASDGAESSYDQSLTEQVTYAKMFYEDYYRFHMIQNTMPAIYNMQELYPDKRKGLVAWYQIMATGKLITELTKWVRKFHLPNTPTFTYSGTMGFEGDIPATKMVAVSFGTSRFTVKGYNNLLNAIRRTTGYGYFPMIIFPEGNVLNVTVAKHDPKMPVLTMGYSATAYFFTRGWDKFGPTAKDVSIQAKTLVDNPPQKEPKRTDWDPTLGPCPKVLYILDTQPGLTP